MADHSKGLAYLTDFEQLKDWVENDAKPLQRANTPLFQRPSDNLPQNNNRSSVMLIHDYAGGYNDYEACQGKAIENQLYTCDHLNHVEVNGVKVLGTIIVQPGSVGAGAILEKSTSGRFWVADKLARIAKRYGFDGWLVNIETAFPLLRWSRSNLEEFLRQLRNDLDEDGKLVWYDALTTFNFVWYQNTLNSLNLPFALAAGSILTNYAWNPDLARRGKQLAEQSGLGAENLFVGIDVWAQNIQGDTKHPRVTWPRRGGGGTATDLGMRDIISIQGGPDGEAQENLSTGIFGPGWSFEHFPGHGKKADEALWTSQSLPNNVTCDCGSDNLHRRVPHFGICNFCREALVGTKSFYHTDFRKAIVERSDGTFDAHLGAQSALPRDRKSPRSGTKGEYAGAIRADLRGSPSRCAYLLERNQKAIKPSQCAHATCRIANVGISEDDEYQISIKYRKPVSYGCRIALFIALEQDSFKVELPDTADVSTISKSLKLREDCMSAVDLVFDIAQLNNHSRDCEDPSPSVLRALDRAVLVEIFEITIQPKRSIGLHCEILNVQVAGSRLIWSIENEKRTGNGLPYSDITGPCSHFLVSIDGIGVGRAYSLEYFLPGVAAFRDMRVQITAVGFDGSIIGSTESAIINGEAWEMVPAQT